MSIQINQKKFIRYVPFLIVLVAFLFLFYPGHSRAGYTGNPVWDVLRDEVNSTGGLDLIPRWRAVLNGVNGFVILLLIVVSFSQILSLNINTYGIKKILPSLIFAVVAANLSFLFIRVMIDVSSAIQSYLVPTTTDKDGFANLMKSFLAWHDQLKLTDQRNSLALNDQFLALVYVGFMLVGMVMIYILAYLLIIRNWIIYFLIPLAPLAFMAMVLPQTKSVFNQWWSNFIKWVFMPVVSLFWIWLGSIWADNAALEAAPYMKLAFAIVCLYLAVTTPFKMGGSIMGKWGGYLTHAWAATGGYMLGRAVGDRRELYKERLATWYNRQGKGKYNPIGYFARSGANLRRGVEEAKKERSASANDLEGYALRSNKRLQERINRSRRLGGEKELADLEMMLNYQNSEAGKKWMQGREGYFAEKSTLEAQTKARDTEAKAIFRANSGNSHFFEDTVLANKEAQMNEANIAQMDKLLMAEFYKRSGVFATPVRRDGESEEDFNQRKERSERIGREYFALMARDKELSDVVSKLEKDGVTAVIRDQVQLQNMKGQLKDLDDIITLLKDKEAGEVYDAAQLDQLQEKYRDMFDRLDISIEESVGADRAKNYILGEASRLIKEEGGGLKTHTRNMVKIDEAAERRGEVKVESIEGFEGLIDIADKDLRASIAKTMSGRAGKHMNVEVQDEAKKYENDMIHPDTALEELMGANGKYRAAFERWQHGDHGANTAEENFEIESRMYYLNQIAQRQQHPFAQSARESIAKLLIDADLKKAFIDNISKAIDAKTDREGIIKEIKAILPKHLAEPMAKFAEENIPKEEAGDVPIARKKTIIERIGQGISSDEVISEYREKSLALLSNRETSTGLYRSMALQRTSGRSDVPSSYLAVAVPESAQLSQEVQREIIRSALESHGSMVDMGKLLSQSIGGSFEKTLKTMGYDVSNHFGQIMQTYTNTLTDAILRSARLQGDRSSEQYQQLGRDIQSAIKANNPRAAIQTIRNLVCEYAKQQGQSDVNIDIADQTFFNPVHFSSAEKLNGQPESTTQPARTNQ